MTKQIKIFNQHQVLNAFLARRSTHFLVGAQNGATTIKKRYGEIIQITQDPTGLQESPSSISGPGGDENSLLLDQIDALSRLGKSQAMIELVYKM